MRSQSSTMQFGMKIQPTSEEPELMTSPYIHLSDNINSLDTINLFINTNEGPQYQNTSHIHVNYKEAAMKNYNTKSESSSHENMFNQVPKRFSQFIIDQQNPHTKQRLDNLSIDKSSVSRLKSNPSLTSKDLRRSSKSRHELGTLSNLSRDISDSMGSQATIFSTRPDQELTERIKSQTSKVKLYPNERKNSSLTRSNALKLKEGSWTYRLRIRLKNLLKKLKNLKYNNFKVSSKRNRSLRKTDSITNKGILRNKKKAAAKEKHLQRIKKISAPISNPNLEKNNVQIVSDLDDNLKYMAGAHRENLNSTNIGSENSEEPSGYVFKNRADQCSTVQSKETSSTIYKGIEKFGKDQEIELVWDDECNEYNKYNECDSKSSSPPQLSPPPHVQKVMPFLEKLSGNENLVDLWRSYLGHVLCKRIQLRQEINLFQSFLIEHETKATLLASSQNDKTIDISTNVSKKSTYNNFYSESSSIYSDSANVRTDEFVDPPAEEFQKTYLNRRSILGDMLDYDSDTSIETNSSYSPSTISQDYDSVSDRNSILSEEMKSYGTISRRHIRTKA